MCMDCPDIIVGLFGEAHLPAIDVDNIRSIFEEHRICDTLCSWLGMKDTLSAGVYLQCEKRFMFNYILPGTCVQARIKLTNVSLVINHRMFFRNINLPAICSSLF